MAAVAPVLRSPLPGGRVTSAFSRSRKHPVTGVVSAHLGADIANGAGYGAPVFSPVDGVVVLTVTGRKKGQSASVGPVFAPGRSGNAPVIGAVGGGCVALGHVTPMVREGQTVRAGAQVGVLDDSGIQTDPHTHTEWWPSGKPSSAVDPAPFIQWWDATVPHDPITPDGGSSASTSEEDDMTPAQAQQLAETAAVVGQLRELMMVPGASYGYPAATLNALRQEVHPRIDAVAAQVASIAAGGIQYPGAQYNALVAIVNTIREDDAAAPAGPTAEDIARAMAPLVAGNLGALSDVDVQRIAKAAADEQSKRLAG